MKKPKPGISNRAAIEALADALELILDVVEEGALSQTQGWKLDLARDEIEKARENAK